MSYPTARIRAWAAHHRMAWWSAATCLALLTGLTVQAAIEPPACAPTGHQTSSGPPTAPGPGERGVALARGADPLALRPGDHVDLWAVDSPSTVHPSAHRVAASARVLALDDRTLTVAVPTDRMDEVAGALHRGGLIPALVPDG